MGNKAVNMLGCGRTELVKEKEDDFKDTNFLKKKEEIEDHKNKLELKKKSFKFFKNLIKENSFSCYIDIESSVDLLATNCYKSQQFLKRKWKNYLEEKHNIKKIREDIKKVKFLTRK